MISQVYGGGGSVSGSSYTNDFLELHNRSLNAVNITGWSLQYAAATGVSWAVYALTGTIPAGGYFLVQLQSAGGGTGSALPTPDAIGGLSLAQTSGKVALVKSTTALTGGCPIPASGVADLVGYGSADCGEGGVTAASLSTTLSARRNALSGSSAACTDSDKNGSDFSVTTPSPHNGSSAPNTCGCAN